MAGLPVLLQQLVGIQDFLTEQISVYSPIEPGRKWQLAFKLELLLYMSSDDVENHYGFVHKLIIIKISVLSHALHISEFCIVL